MNRFQKLKNYYNWGGRFLNDPVHIATSKCNQLEGAKTPSRTDIINYLLKKINKDEAELYYLEIGVRNPNDNFKHIKAGNKYGVDPGVEFKDNPVEFKMTSDAFFEQLRDGKVLNPSTRFDVIFVDGLHLAEQVLKDIYNSLDFISDTGFVVLHDCNPPTEWHAREMYEYQISPAMNNWNGTTWKAFVQAREIPNTSACCIDTDWGVGVIAKNGMFGKPVKQKNPFFEFMVFDNDRVNQLNLLDFNEFKTIVERS